MNNAEIKAFKWLLKLGMKPEQIEFRYNKTPDFILSDGRKFEVKKATGNKIKNIIISEKQFDSLIKDPNTNILLFNNKQDEPLMTLSVKGLKKGMRHFHDVNISWKKDIEDSTSLNISVPKDLFNKFKACLRKIYWKEQITIDKGIIRLIEEFINKNFEK